MRRAARGRDLITSEAVLARAAKEAQRGPLFLIQPWNARNVPRANPDLEGGSMPTVDLGVRHHARCDCLPCQLSGRGAFGPQPDGSKPFYIVVEKARKQRRGEPRQPKAGSRP